MARSTPAQNPRGWARITRIAYPATFSPGLTTRAASAARTRRVRATVLRRQQLGNAAHDLLRSSGDILFRDPSAGAAEMALRTECGRASVGSRSLGSFTCSVPQMAAGRIGAPVRSAIRAGPRLAGTQPATAPRPLREHPQHVAAAQRGLGPADSAQVAFESPDGDEAAHVVELSDDGEVEQFLLRHPGNTARKGAGQDRWIADAKVIAGKDQPAFAWDVLQAPDISTGHD